MIITLDEHLSETALTKREHYNLADGILVLQACCIRLH